MFVANKFDLCKLQLKVTNLRWWTLTLKSVQSNSFQISYSDPFYSSIFVHPYHFSICCAIRVFIDCSKLIFLYNCTGCRDLATDTDSVITQVPIGRNSSFYHFLLHFFRLKVSSTRSRVEVTMLQPWQALQQKSFFCLLKLTAWELGPTIRVTWPWQYPLTMGHTSEGDPWDPCGQGQRQKVKKLS